MSQPYSQEHEADSNADAHYMLPICIKNVAELAPVVIHTLKEPGMEVSQIDFLNGVSETVIALLHGLEYQSWKDNTQSCRGEHG